MKVTDSHYQIAIIKLPLSNSLLSNSLLSKALFIL